MPSVLVMNVTLGLVFPLIKTPSGVLFEYGEILRSKWYANLYEGQLWCHLWYVNVELILCLIAPVFLFGLYRFGYKAFAPIMGICITSVTYFYFAFKRFITEHTSSPSFTPVTRCSPWLIGLMLGYLIFHHKGTKKLSKVEEVAISLICFSVIIAILYIPKTHFNGPLYYTSIRIFWAILIGIPIYLMIIGHLSCLKSFLSHPIFQLLSNLSYSAYLWHAPILTTIRNTQRTPVYINSFVQFQFTFLVIGISLLIAIPANLFVELPFKNLQQIIIINKTLAFIIR